MIGNFTRDGGKTTRGAKDGGLIGHCVAFDGVPEIFCELAKDWKNKRWEEDGKKTWDLGRMSEAWKPRNRDSKCEEPALGAVNSVRTHRSYIGKVIFHGLSSREK